MKKNKFPLGYTGLICLALLLSVTLLNCSNDDFEKPSVVGGVDIGSTEKIITCVIKSGENLSCLDISQNACSIMGGAEKQESDVCIPFSCGWDKEELSYGGKATLTFELDSTGLENCTWQLFNRDTILTEGTEYAISDKKFLGLSYNKDTSVIVSAAVTCGDLPKAQKTCTELKVDSVPKPIWTCGWNATEVKYGKKASLSFDFTGGEYEGCTSKLMYNETVLEPKEYTVSASAFPGLKYDSITNLTVKSIVTCPSIGVTFPAEDCSTIKVDSVLGPAVSGTLTFKYDYTGTDTTGFFVGKTLTPADLNNTLTIENKAELGCGDITIKFEGSPTVLGTPVKATAVVKCATTGDEEFELSSITASVLPNAVIGECELSGTSKPTMLSKDSLELLLTVTNNYDRCEVEYSVDGTTYSASNSFALASYGNTTLSNIKSKVTCGTNAPVIKNCPAIDVASFISTTCGVSEDRNHITVAKGTTILEFTCANYKQDFYMSCLPEPVAEPPNYQKVNNYTIEIEGHVVGNSQNDIRPVNGNNGYNLPDLMPKAGGKYPKQVIIKTEEEGLTCGLW